jgi:tetratricopeptide (TPR) repeat protein
VTTPAEFAIQNAQAEIAGHPEHFAGYNHLAVAYARRARESGDAAYFDKAADALKRSLGLAPGNFEGRKAGVVVALGRHEWKDALDEAKKINKETPDDVAVYGYIADAEIALGDYKSAVDAAQWMLNIRPGNAGGLIRAGRLRELYKDWSGSLEAWQMAYEATPFAEREERAWILVQMSRVHAEMGDAKSAESDAKEALALFPGYYLATAALSAVRDGGPDSHP